MLRSSPRTCCQVLREAFWPYCNILIQRRVYTSLLPRKNTTWTQLTNSTPLHLETRYQHSHSHFNPLHHRLLTLCHPLLTPPLRCLHGDFCKSADVVHQRV
jgi:hypothetical protein